MSKNIFFKKNIKINKVFPKLNFKKFLVNDIKPLDKAKDMILHFLTHSIMYY